MHEPGASRGGAASSAASIYYPVNAGGGKEEAASLNTIGPPLPTGLAPLTLQFSCAIAA